MLNFFVHLENRIGVPFTLIGTPDAIPLLSGQFRQARRVSEQGDIVWDRMNEIKQESDEFNDDDDDDFEEEIVPATQAQSIKDKEPEVDPIWRDFVQTLWIYQYVENVTTLKENLLRDKRARALYSASKGIPAVTQTVFLLAQRRAITTGIEKITSGIIKSVARDSQNMIRAMLDKARMHKPRSIPSVDDLFDWNAWHRVSEDTNADSYENAERVGITNASEGEVLTGSKTNDHSGQKKQSSSAASKRSLSQENIKASRKPKYSKDDLRNSSPQDSGTSKNVNKRKNKYSKSVSEYVS